MHILLIGANHESAPLALRERLARAADHAPQRLQHLCTPPSPLQETVLLSTCNRVEVYAVTDEPARAGDLLTRALLGGPEITKFLYMRTDQAAVKHLCSVAAGIDSLVLGETQVLGQVKEALQTGLQAQTAGTILATLFRSAVRAGKRARNETAIGRHALSVSSVAVDLAIRSLGSLETRTALIIGSGEMSKLAAQLLQERGIGHLLIANRTDQHGRELAQRLYADSIPFDQLPESLIDVDLVISSTSASQLILNAVEIAQVMKGRTGRSLLLIDLAVPRDIDPVAGTIEGVQLYNIDDLRAAGEEHLRERQSELPRVREIIQEETKGFREWLAARQAVSLLKELRDRAERIRQEELARALSRLATLTHHDQRVIETLSRRVVNKILHEPTVRLKEGTVSSNRPASYTEIFSELFGLNGRGDKDHQ
jgi:glutamyl-tRNA reductase